MKGGDNKSTSVVRVEYIRDLSWAAREGRYTIIEGQRGEIMSRDASRAQPWYAALSHLA
jgi:hypothetical protein